MSTVKKDSKAKLVDSVAYVLNDITYLPHYVTKNKFVSPGYGSHHLNTFSESELKKAGAYRVVESLIERAWAKV